jgi:hypothetical protein
MVHDLVADPKTVVRAYRVRLRDLSEPSDLSPVIIAVAHDDYVWLADKLNAMPAPAGPSSTFDRRSSRNHAVQTCVIGASRGLPIRAALLVYSQIPSGSFFSKKTCEK